MAIPFSRSIRSMNHDRYLPGFIVISLIGVILILWIAWFFGGQLASYESSQDYQIREDGMLMVKFPTKSVEHILPGQTANLIVSTADEKSTTTIKGEVMNIPTSPEEWVEIFLFSSDPLSNQLNGQVKIQVGNTSPAALIWNSIQK